MSKVPCETCLLLPMCRNIYHPYDAFKNCPYVGEYFKSAFNVDHFTSVSLWDSVCETLNKPQFKLVMHGVEVVMTKRKELP